MGNSPNNFSNKSQQLSLYLTVCDDPCSGITSLRHKESNVLHLMKTVTTDNHEKSQQIKAISLSKIHNNTHLAPITPLQGAFLEQTSDLCGSCYKIGLIFEVGESTLKQDIMDRRREGGRYEEKEIINIMRSLVLGVSFYKQIEQSHERMSTSNVYLKKGGYVLADPMISSGEGVYESPQKAEIRKNRRAEYDWFASNLYGIGMVALEVYHLKSMASLYQTKVEPDQEKLKEMIRQVRYKQVQRLIRELLGPPRLRVQALSHLISSSTSESTSTHFKPHNPYVEPPKHPSVKQKTRQMKRQMRKQLKQRKEDIKKMIESNATRQVAPPVFKIQTRLEQQNASVERKGLSSDRRGVQRIDGGGENKGNVNYISHIHVHPPEIKYHTTINITINEHSQPPITQQPSPRQKPFHRHTRSNSNLSHLAQIKPSTSSTCHARRNSSNSNHESNITLNNQEQSFIRINQQPVPFPPTPPILLKDGKGSKGVLNTTVSSHGVERVMNTSHSLSSLSNLHLSKMNISSKYQNEIVGSSVMNGLAYIHEYSSVYNPSRFDELHLNSSMVSRVSNGSRGSGVSHGSNRSQNELGNSIPVHQSHRVLQKSHSRSNSDVSVGSNSSHHVSNHNQSIQFPPSNSNRTIHNLFDPETSLLYSRSLSRDKTHQQSESSIDFPLLTKLSSKLSKNSVQQCSESELLHSQHSHNNQSALLQSNFTPENNSKVPSSTNKHLYQGSMKNNLKEGQGKLFTSSGKLIYQGEFKDGLYQGYGKLVNEDIVFVDEIDYKSLDLGKGYWVNYEGSFVNGEKHGFGKIVFCNGEVYEGQLVEGEIQGFGQFWDQNEEVLDGIWKSGKLERLI